MSRFTAFDSLTSLETLDLRLSPTSLSLGASFAAPVFSHRVPEHDDTLPDPELPMAVRAHQPFDPDVGPGRPRLVLS